MALIRSVLNGSLHCPDEVTAYELVSLQLRKILELVAFSSLVANREVYAAEWQKYQQHWRVKDLLVNLAKVNPDYYPRPVRVTVDSETGAKSVENIDDGFLTPADFQALYDKCAEVLHTWNPFRDGERRIDFGKPVAEWLERIQRLLAVHIMRLAGSTELWLVYMSYPPENNVHALVASPYDSTQE
ncbi:MAG: hypothetical protein Q8P50_06550 [Bacillota bacterium]|nr:hypothetical protein [Bacillota bacterium]